MMMKDSKKKINKVVTMIAVPFGFFIILELLLQLLALFSITKFDAYNKSPFWEFHARDVSGLFQPQVFDYDKDLFWRFRPGYSRDILINQEGFLGPLNQETQPGVKRIVILGDSSSACHGVQYEEGYGSLLSTLLMQNGIQNLTLNRSTYGYTSSQGLILLQRDIKELDPDLLIVSFGYNDSNRERIKPDKEYLIENQSFMMSVNTFLNNFQIYKGLKSLLKVFRPPVLNSDLSYRVPQADYRKNLSYIIKTARLNNCRVILLNISAPTVYRDSMRQIANKQDIPFLDGENVLSDLYQELTGSNPSALDADEEHGFDGQMMALRQNNIVYSDCAHPNAKGHQRIAEKLLPEVMTEFAKQ